MGVNWSLLQPVDIGGMFRQGYEQGQQMVERARAKSALAAFTANPSDPEAQSALAAASPEFALKLAGHRWEQQEKEAERARLAQFYTEPDPGMASKRAYQAGYPDIGKQLAELDEATRKRALDEAKGAAPFIHQANKLPYEQRKAFLRSQAAALANVGFTAEEIEAYDPTDANNAGILNIATTLDQAREMDRVRWVTDPAGGQFPVDYYGRDVRDGGSRGSGGGNVIPPAAGTPGKFEYTPVAGAQETSGYRSAADNARVGGVANSYHLTDQARDFVPPPGMSMGELHAQLQAANPHLRVINEGDHVHIQPTSRDQFSPGNIDLASRPRVNNADGSFSTLRSISIGTDQGEVLIPTIAPDGRQMSEEEAIAEYRRSGKHLGIFRTPEEATDAAKAISEAQEAIAAGADPAAVKSRLANMGVRL